MIQRSQAAVMHCIRQFSQRLAARANQGSMATIFLVSCALAFAVQPAVAEVPTDPGDYVPVPPGTNLALLYYQHATRNDLYSDGDKVRMPFKLDTNVGIVRLIHYTGIAGLNANVQAVVPFARVRLRQPNTVESSGIGDPLLGAVLWIMNDSEAQRYMALSGFLGIPIGKYDGNKGAINVGENRWKGVVHVSYGQQIAGKLGIDVTGEYAIHGHNDDFAGATYKQRPTYELQTHLRYALTPATVLGLSYFRTAGGRGTVDGVEQNGRINTGRFLVSAAHFLSPTWQIEGQFGQDIHVSNGPKEDRRFNLRLLRVF